MMPRFTMLLIGIIAGVLITMGLMIGSSKGESPRFSVGSPFCYGGLSIFPLYVEDAPDSVAYLTSDEALESTTEAVSLLADSGAVHPPDPEEVRVLLERYIADLWALLMEEFSPLREQSLTLADRERLYTLWKRYPNQRDELLERLLQWLFLSKAMLQDSLAIGIVAALDGKIVGAEVYRAPGHIRKVWREVLTSYTAEAWKSEPEGKSEREEPVTVETIQRFLDEVLRLHALPVWSAGRFKIECLESEDVVGFQSYLGDKLLYLKVWPKP